MKVSYAQTLAVAGFALLVALAAGPRPRRGHAFAGLLRPPFAAATAPGERRPMLPVGMRQLDLAGTPRSDADPVEGFAARLEGLRGLSSSPPSLRPPTLRAKGPGSEAWSLAGAAEEQSSGWGWLADDVYAAERARGGGVPAPRVPLLSERLYRLVPGPYRMPQPGSPQELLDNSMRRVMPFGLPPLRDADAGPAGRRRELRTPTVRGGGPGAESR